MLKSILGSYKIIVDGTWGEISYKNEVVEYGNIEDQKIDAQKNLLNYIIKDAKNLIKEGKEVVESWLSQFNKEELKIFRTEYIKKADYNTLNLLYEKGYTIESYINSLQ